MKAVIPLQLTDRLITLFGFAKKARMTVSGLEAVKRAIMKEKLAIVLVQTTVGKNTLKKIQQLTRRNDIPIFGVSGDSPVEVQLWGGYKIYGVRKGELANAIMEQVKQENQWQ